MITDKELDEIIRKPRPGSENGVYKNNNSLYRIYISHKLWRTMDKDRMLQICERMLKTNNGLSDLEINKIRAIMDELKEQGAILPKNK